MNRSSIRTWIDAIKSEQGIDIPEIARAAGVSPSTIYRWLDDKHPFTPSMTTIQKIAAVYSTPIPESIMPERVLSGQAGPGLAEAEVSYIGETPPELQAGNNQGVWRIDGRSLELAGYLPGDLVLVDMSVVPHSGDVVCAQVYNIERGTAETKLRVYDPPFLLSRAVHPGPSDKPLFIDHERVHIAGTVIRSMRLRE
jgi:transcriptional regulator with XRE-family HTH domain